MKFTDQQKELLNKPITEDEMKETKLHKFPEPVFGKTL